MPGNNPENGFYVNIFSWDACCPVFRIEWPKLNESCTHHGRPSSLIWTHEIHQKYTNIQAFSFIVALSV
jgi:hypothetical protein